MIRANTALTVAALRGQPAVEGLIAQDRLAVVGEYYSPETGAVSRV
jgi:carbonic anhydrase